MSPAGTETPGLRDPGAPTPEATGSQSLYRLTYDSGEGRSSLKVVLRERRSRFQIVASDIAGRRLFSLDHFGDRSVMVDHRSSTFCRAGASATLPEVHPDELPLASVPRVLAGEFPIAEPMPVAEGHAIDEHGRRWRMTSDERGLLSWTVLDGQGPLVWWGRQEDGGILSRRGGEQYRWSLVVRESLSGPLADLVPEGFTEGVCDG